MEYQQLYQARVKEAEGIQSSMQDLKAEIQTLNSNRQKYLSQLSENTMAKEELERLEEDAAVYKLIGPALVKQDRAEALDTVLKRLDFIRSTVEGVDKELAAKMKEFESKRSAIIGLQQQMMALQKQMEQMQMQQQQPQQVQQQVK
jgi:prefoldin beta subunit